MNFGRRTKSWGAVGRRILGEREKAVSNGLAQDERSALLEGRDAPELSLVEEEKIVNEAVPPTQDPIVQGDPTQHLLTALGRFQRQVNRAEGGAPAEIWTDDCIEQLVEGIEVAIQNDWQDVQEALTDTARVLQSYENVGKASDAVEFLQDSYEILCLMVGDLIVDNIRSGVMQKWRDRFGRATAALDAAGIPLIDDDGETPVAEETAPVNEESVPEEIPEAEESTIVPFATPQPVEEIQEEVLEEVVEEIPVVEEAPVPAHEEPVTMDSPFELPEAQDAIEVGDPAPELDEVIAEESFPLDMELETSETKNELSEGEGGELVYEPLGDAATTMTPTAEFDDDSLDELPLFSAVSENTEDVNEPEVISQEELEIVFEDPQPSAVEVVVEEETVPEEPVASDAALELESMVQELEEAPEEHAELELTLDVVPEPAPEPEAVEQVVEVVEETEEIVEVEATAAVEEVSVPAQEEVSAPQSTNNPAEALLHTTQQAMAQGNVADAKMLALELAVCMARQEAEGAQDGVLATEAVLAENKKAISNAEREVTSVDTEVQTVVKALEEQQTILSEKSDTIDTLCETIAQTDAGMIELEEKIQALQEKLEQERASKTEQETTLATYQDESTRVESEISRLSEEEGKVRQVLSQAEGAVTTLLDAQLACRSDIENAQAILRKKEEAVQDIERTMGYITGSTSTETNDRTTENETE